MLNTSAFIIKEIKDSAENLKVMAEDQDILSVVAGVTDEIIAAYKRGNKTLFAGNGGSAADAQHLAAEFVSRFYFDRPGLSALSLSSDPSVVTAIGNDYGFENLFSRQVEAHGNRGDILIALSTSGKSPNILKAIATAKKRGLLTVAMTSERAVEMAKSCDFSIQVKSKITPKIQECHITIGHAICAGVEAALFQE